MPWCPKCKVEFVKGTTICSDCGSELVEEMTDGTILIPEIHFLTEKEVTEFIDFLQYSNIDSASYSYDPNNECYTVSVPEEKVKDSIKFYEIYKEENSEVRKRGANGENVGCNCTTPTHSSSPYVKKEEKYEDLKSSASTFLVFGIGGLIFTILNINGTFSFFRGVVSYVVMCAMFLGFIYVGITSYIKSKQLKTEIGSENDLTDSITNWLKEQITKEKLNEMNDTSLSDEVNFLRKMEQIKLLVIHEFGMMDDAYLDRIIEDFYNENFDNE